ncbi:hypothetical protein [Rhodococcus sp. 1168]|uniref:hypothetical protein n=1 Tax=Rhodococcus sp. 1168 TaxID=2018041 RepID=UPI001593A6AD|nr:hypothetical protein [Rhodococcus sp. 1168]
MTEAETDLVPFATRMNPALQRRLKIACAERGMRIQDAVYEAVNDWLRGNLVD